MKLIVPKRLIAHVFLADSTVGFNKPPLAALFTSTLKVIFSDFMSDINFSMLASLLSSRVLQMMLEYGNKAIHLLDAVSGD